MTCPQCQKELPGNFEREQCPFCGEGIADIRAPSLQPQPPARRFQFNWQLFLLALLLPPSLTQLSALIFGRVAGLTGESVSPIVGLVGAIVGGMGCGVVAAVSLAYSLPGRILLSILFSVVMIVVCLALCCFGCAVGGFKF